MRIKESSRDYSSIREDIIIGQIKQDAAKLETVINQKIATAGNNKPVRKDLIKIAVTLNNLLKEIE